MLKIGVYADSYLNNKSDYQGDGWLEYQPVDLNGTYVPLKKSLADGQKVIESINERVGLEGCPKTGFLGGNVRGKLAYKS